MGSALAVLIGGAISLVSTLTAILLQHLLSIQKLRTETRQYPFKVVYDKQTAFFDRLAPICLELNSFTTTVDVWLGETTPDARARVKEAAEKCGAVNKLDDAIQQYYMYLPAGLLHDAKELYWKCLGLAQRPAVDLTYDCINSLFAFQNRIRQYVGIDRLSGDFLKAFGRPAAGDNRAKAKGKAHADEQE